MLPMRPAIAADGGTARGRFSFKTNRRAILPGLGWRRRPDAAAIPGGAQAAKTVGRERRDVAKLLSKIATCA